MPTILTVIQTLGPEHPLYQAFDHIMNIVKSGDATLMHRLETRGYGEIKKPADIDHYLTATIRTFFSAESDFFDTNEPTPQLVNTCARLIVPRVADPNLPPKTHRALILLSAFKSARRDTKKTLATYIHQNCDLIQTCRDIRAGKDPALASKMAYRIELLLSIVEQYPSLFSAKKRQELHGELLKMFVHSSHPNKATMRKQADRITKLEFPPQARQKPSSSTSPKRAQAAGRKAMSPIKNTTRR